MGIEDLSGLGEGAKCIPVLICVRGASASREGGRKTPAGGAVRATEERSARSHMLWISLGKFGSGGEKKKGGGT